MKTHKIGKLLLRILLGFLVFVILFTAGTMIYHRIQSSRELAVLKEKGYYNPVSVGDYCLNVE